MKTLFSGMTEGFSRLASGDVASATAANVLTLPVAGFALLSVLTWRFPRIRNRRDEICAFSGVIAASIVVNLFN